LLETDFIEIVKTALGKKEIFMINGFRCTVKPLSQDSFALQKLDELVNHLHLKHDVEKNELVHYINTKVVPRSITLVFNWKNHETFGLILRFTAEKDKIRQQITETLGQIKHGNRHEIIASGLAAAGKTEVLRIFVGETSCGPHDYRLLNQLFKAIKLGVPLSVVRLLDKREEDNNE